MVSFKGEIKDIVKTFENELIMTITTNASNLSSDELKSLQDSKNGVKIDIAKWREKRSLDSNAYAWVLMDKIAEKTNTTKEHVYKEIIKRVGVFEILPLKDVAVEKFIKNWQSKGLGWVCDNLGSSPKLEGFTKIVAYYGTSTYDTKEMSRFIDEVVSEAQELGIQTETPDKIEEMKSLWSTQNA
jgi:hypothetical protein